jgi:hypothetical protein
LLPRCRLLNGGCVAWLEAKSLIGQRIIDTDGQVVRQDSFKILPADGNASNVAGMNPEHFKHGNSPSLWSGLAAGGVCRGGDLHKLAFSPLGVGSGLPGFQPADVFIH